MNVGTLEIQMMANLARLQQDMEKATSIVSGAMSGISKYIELAKSALSGLAAGMTIGAFASMVKGSIDAAAGLHDMSIQTGASVASLMAFKAVAATSETTIDGIATAMNKLAKNMAVANESSKGTGEVIKMLGINFKDLQAMTPDQQMLTVAKALDKFQDGAGKSAAAMTLFGKEGAKMLPFLKDLADSADEVGAKLTKQQVAAKAAQAAMADDFGDNLVKIQKASDAWKKDVAMGMLPALYEASQAFIEVTGGAGGFKQMISGLAQDGTITQWSRAAITAVTFLSDALEGVWRIVKSLGQVAWALFKTFGEAIGAVTAQLVEVASTAGSVISHVLKGEFSMAADEVKASLDRQKAIATAFASDAGDRFSELGSTIADTFSAQSFGSKIRERMADMKDLGSTAKDAKEQLNFDPNASENLKKYTQAFSALGTEAARLQQAGVSLKAYQDAAEHAKRAEMDFETSFGKLKDLSEPQKALKDMADAVDHLTSRNKLLAESMSFRDAATKAERDAALIAQSGAGAANEYTDALARQADGKMQNLSATEQATFIQNAFNKVQGEANKSLASSTDGVKVNNAAVQAGIAALNADAIASRYSEVQKVQLANANSLASQSYKDQALAAAGVTDAINKIADAQQQGIAMADRVREMNASLIFDDQQRAQAQLKIDVDKYQKQLDLAEAAYEKLASLKDAANAEQLAADRAALDQSKQALQDFIAATNTQIKFDALKSAFDDIATSMTSAFGDIGKTLGAVFQAYGKGVTAQIRAQHDLAEAKKKSDDDPDKIAAIQRAQLNGSLAQIQSYGDMATAAQGFFNEGSKGYQAMHAASMVLHGAEVALSLIKGINAVLTQGEGDPYSAFARMAAMAAIVTGLGVALSGGGGGGGQSAADVQKAQGTGSVFGDSGAKSDSIRRSIEQLTANSSDMLPINQSMLTALQNIESAMAGLTNLVVRTTGLTDGTNMGIQTGMLSGGDAVTNMVASIGEKVFGSSNILGTLSRTLSNLYSNTKQTIVDSGLQYGGSVRDLQDGRGFDQYASIDTTKSSFFGLSKSTSNSVQTQGVSPELAAQFGLIFTSLDKSLQAASVALGGSASDVTKVLDNLTLESTKVSLKGLTGTALTDALNSVISKSMDEIAQAAFPQFDAFRQVGEGYAETVLRLAGDYAKLDAVLAASSTTFGATGIASIAAREHLIELAGGIDQLASQTSSFATNFLSQAEQLAPVQKYVTDQLAAMGLQSLTTRDQFKDYVVGLADSGALLNTTGDITTRSQEQYTALLALADAFAKTHAATVDLTKSEQEVADERKDLQSQYDQLMMTSAQLAAKARAEIAPYNLALYDQVQALQGVKDAQSALVDAYTKQKTALQSVVDLQLAAAAATQKQMDALKLGALSDMSPERKYFEAQRQFDVAAPGDAKNAAAQALLEASRNYNGSTMAYSQDYAKVQAALALQAASQTSAASIAQQQLGALDKQVGELIDINSGVDTLNGTMQGVQAAILGLGSSMLAVAAANTAAGTPNTGNGAALGMGAIDGVLTGIYKDLLGRAPDAEGLKFWEAVASSGQSYDQIIAGFKGSPEYIKLHGAHANGGIASGWSLVGEQGPEVINFDQPARVYTASQSREMFSGGRDSAAARESVELLREVLIELRADKTQRGAVGKETIAKLSSLEQKLAKQSRETARAE
jgi:hypothetical protein